MTSQLSFWNTVILRRPGGANFAEIIKIATMVFEATFKDSKKFRESENTIYICISWYDKTYWFPVKNTDIRTTQACITRFIYFSNFFL